jgi:hypothetical protein
MFGYMIRIAISNKSNLLTRIKNTKQIKEEKRKKPKPEEHEGMPQHHQCPPIYQQRY